MNELQSQADGMAAMMQHTDWNGDSPEWSADDSFEDDDYGDDDVGAEADTIDCPYCGRAMFDDAPSCPHCGNYITDEDRPAAAKPRWFVVAAWLCLLGASTWFYFLWAR